MQIYISGEHSASNNWNSISILISICIYSTYTMNALHRIFQCWKNWTSPFSSCRTQNTMRYIKQKWNICLINDRQSSNHRIERTCPQCSSQKYLPWSAHGCDHVSKVMSSSSASILSVIFIITIHIQHHFHCMSMDSFSFHHQLRFLLVSILIEYYGVGVRAALSLLAYLLLMLRFDCLWRFSFLLLLQFFITFPALIFA